MSSGQVFTSGRNRELIEAVTSEDLMNAAREIFSPEKTSRLIFQ